MEKIDEIKEKSEIYPDKKTMELFLEIGNKLSFFEKEQSMENWNNISYYKEVIAVNWLAITINYLMSWEWNKMDEFMKILNSGNQNEIIRKMANIILEVRWDKEKNDFVEESIKLCKERIGQKDNLTLKDIPAIPPQFLPERYWARTSANLIDEKFESELSRLKWVSEWADRIQEEFQDHTFKKWDNSEAITELISNL